MDSANEVKSRLNIEDIVSEYVQLKRAGRNYKGLSPFTNENTPSFIVSPDKQIWHDFSSGKGGDVISFIEQVEGLDFKGSLELLARKAGVDLSKFQKNSSGTGGKQKERLFQAVEAAVSYYQVELTKNDAPLRYVREKRGYEKQTLIDFRFGYSPKGSANLATYLKGKGFTEQELTDSGLCVRRSSGLVDMFRNRLMITLTDPQGRPVGFTARQLDNDKNSPKYINTPSTILYDKGRQLFGFSMAKEQIRKSGYAVVVEGNLDVVASHQAGIKHVVASAGTALTSFHLKTLQRFTGDVRLAFDDDRAGQEAAERTIPLAQSLGIELSFIGIPEGKDPDELIKQDKEEWLRVVEKPVYMVDWLIERISSSVDLTTAPGKRQFTTKVFEIVKHIKDRVEQEHYLRIIADMTKTSTESINAKFNQGASKSNQVRLKTPKIDKAVQSSQDSKQLVREQHYLSILVSVPDLRSKISIMPVEIFSEQSRNLLESSNSLQEVNNSDEYVKMLTLLFEETYQHTEHDELDYQIKQLARRLIEFYTRNKKTIILEKLENAEPAEEKKLLEQVNELEKLRQQVVSA
ncbi:MAG: DNA primase [Candidatus Saccharimonadales bacterium]|jgi:DNA primase